MANGQLWEIDSQGNKKLISGMVTGELHKYTMAEYTALTDKPTDWICTDYDATSEYGINATEVKYDSSHSVKDMLKVTTIYTTTGLTILRCGNIVMYDFTGYTAKNNDDFPYTPSHNVRGVITDTLRVVIGGGKIELISNGTAVTTNTNLYGTITVIEY